MTKTEKIVYDLCNRTFLSLWSYSNPVGKKDKELCDVLVICEPDIVIFSVKEINIKESELPEVDFNRWTQRAIEDSVKQIYGAERFINNRGNIKQDDLITPILLKENIDWQIHRIAVAFGRGEKFHLKYGEFGKGYVHVFDENSVKIILEELDTIKDFLRYISAKEKLFQDGKMPISYAEEDMLAYYLLNSRNFPEDFEVIIFNRDLWEGLSTDPHYLMEKEKIEVSYVWDNLLERLIADFKENELIQKVGRDELEIVVRQMAREDRNSRQAMSEQFLDFIGYFNEPKVKARIVKSSESDVIYLFVLGEYEERENRVIELRHRSLVARSLIDCETVIGLATERYNPKRYSLDYLYLNLPELDSELFLEAKMLREEYGYFKNVNEKKI